MKQRIVLGIFVGVLSVTTSALAAPQKLRVTTTSFAKGGTIPTAYTCQGTDTSPNLAWSKVPKKTKSIAIVLADPDAPGGTFYHWGRYNISRAVTAITEDAAPGSAKETTNDFGSRGYNGPCPPSGETHRYFFTVYALSKKIPNTKSTAALHKSLTKGSLKKFVLASGSVTGKYTLQVSEEDQCLDSGGTWSCTTIGEQTSCTCR